MHRTQILLEEQQYHFLVREARVEGISLSRLLRRLVHERMSERREPASAIDRLAGLGEGDGSPVAEEHDRYLYGKPDC